MTIPEYVPLKMAKFPGHVEELRSVLHAMWSNWSREEVLWLTGMLMDGIGAGEFFSDDEEEDDTEVPS